MSSESSFKESSSPRCEVDGAFRDKLLLERCRAVDRLEARECLPSRFNPKRDCPENPRSERKLKWLGLQNLVFLQAWHISYPHLFHLSFAFIWHSYLAFPMQLICRHNDVYRLNPRWKQTSSDLFGYSGVRYERRCPREHNTQSGQLHCL